MGFGQNILVISDLHLGEQIGPDRTDDLEIDRALVSFLDHHREHTQNNRPWTLVINGDMVDFIGALVMPAEAGWVKGLPADDHTYGLGDGATAAALKISRVVEHHQGVFRALARFVDAGHSLAMVIGNHDADFHWPEVQRIVKQGLAKLAGVESNQEAFFERIVFHSWVFHEEGLIWIEHGHQYDPYCSFEEVLAPATDGQRLDPTVGAVVLRYLTNRFDSNVSKYWSGGFFTYLLGWYSQGWSKMLSILAGYRDMVMRLFWHWKALRPVRVAARQARARSRLQKLAQKLKIPERTLVSLSLLKTKPVVSSLGRWLLAVQLDRLLLLMSVPLLVMLPLFVLPTPFWWAYGPLLMLLVGSLSMLAAKSREPIDPRQTMALVSRSIRKLVGVPIVVFGHSHYAEAQRDATGWTFNTGTWVPHPNPENAFTHLRIVRETKGVTARLCQWREGRSFRFDREGLIAEAFVEHLPAATSSPSFAPEGALFGPHAEASDSVLGPVPPLVPAVNSK